MEGNYVKYNYCLFMIQTIQKIQFFLNQHFGKLLIITIVFLIISLCIPQQSIFDIVFLNSSSALCLDGSPAAYYISRDGNSKHIYIVFQGGGWCGAEDLNTTLESCYQRSKIEMGSSKNYKQTISEPYGSLSNSNENNFRNWKKIFITYCDGSGHQGTKKQSIKYKNVNLYFRGHNNTVQILEDLQLRLKIFSQAEKVVVSGTSAGGLAVYFWTNYISDRVKKGKVWALPDAGIFLDSLNVKTNKTSHKQSLKNLMKLSNQEIDPPVPQCVKQFKNSKQNCMFAQNLYYHIKVPQFAIQSLYDTWSIQNILGIKCTKYGSLSECNTDERIQIQQYHRNMTNLLLSISNEKKNGCWAPACADHFYSANDKYYSQNYKVPQNSINSASNSVKNWIQQTTKQNQHIDRLQWPQNKPCSGI